MTDFSNVSFDLTEIILSHLPIPSLLRASAVCKFWHSIIFSPTFTVTHNQIHRDRPWFLLYGLHNTTSGKNQSFAFDPLSDLWFRLPPFPISHPGSCFLGSDGYFFTTAPHFSYAPIFKPTWTTTSPLKFSRVNPLLGVFRNGSSAAHFIVVGGVRFIGGLVDIEDRLAVEIYNPYSDFWEVRSPLPADFRSGNSSHSLSSALFEGKFYVLGIHSFFISCFDLHDYVWSEVQTLRPPGIVFSFLIACSDRLVLAGLCNSPAGPSFVLWKIEVETMEFSEISLMPNDLLHSLIDSEEEDSFASLKCVGSGNLIYVFSEEYHRKYPACVCEISHSTGKCRWRRVPPLPSPVNRFHKTITFCSTVSLQTIFGRKEEEAISKSTILAKLNTSLI